MISKRARLSGLNLRAANLVIWAFGLLALGDTGHVGFRVIAYAMGSLESNIAVAGQSFGLVGLGALSTGVTVTIFYMILLEIWRIRFNRQYGWFEYLLLAEECILGLSFYNLELYHLDA